LPTCSSVCPQDAPDQTAKAIATANNTNPYVFALAGLIAGGLAHRGSRADALAQAIAEAYKQVRRQ
jgi:hypothetical protein